MIRVHVTHNARLLREAIADALARERRLSVVGLSAEGKDGLAAVA